jgi:hypothetical protein
VGLGLIGNVALAEWLRRVPAKYMGFPRKSSNLLGDGYTESIPIPATLSFFQIVPRICNDEALKFVECHETIFETL